MSTKSMSFGTPVAEEPSTLGEKISDTATQVKDKVSEFGRTAADKIDENRDAAASGLDSAYTLDLRVRHGDFPQGPARGSGRRSMPTSFRVVTLVVTAALTTTATFSGPMTGYVQTNLVSDIPGLAANTDPNLRNPWGISFSPGGSPFWVSDNAAGLVTLYNGAGSTIPLVVSVPGASGGASKPTRLDVDLPTTLC
jgi:hypothetical protein